MVKSCPALAVVLSMLLAVDSTSTFNVKCQHSGFGFTCAMTDGSSSDADVTGRFYDEIQETGWGRLYVQSTSITPLTAFAAGYLEGALTAHRIVQHLANYKAKQGLDPVPPGIQSFVESSDAWIRAQVVGADAQDPYWNNVRFQYQQMDGMLQGANTQLTGLERLSRLDIILLGLIGDLADIKSAVNVSEQASFDNMTASELLLWTQPRGHCSALVKLVPDSSELFVGHNTWFDYSVMIRIWKRYEFGIMPAVGMSSFPGILASMDDFYQMDNLVATETTNSNYNNDLFKSVTPQALPYWIRAMAANYMASTGPEWMEIFKRYNGGTYNNMWMVVDYGKFTPGRPLPEGVLTVGEQLPGYFHYEDQTRVLSYGYWPSFNIAVYPETARLMKQDKMVDSKGIAFSYQDNPRAQIFRRDQGAIQNDADMQRALRYNKYQTDPLAQGNPCSQLACRGDMGVVTPANSQTSGSLKNSIHSRQATGFGAIDAKYTSLAHVRARRTIAISGPTHDDQTVFDWTQAVPDVQKTPHEGQPNRFDFGWYIMMPQMSAASLPWQRISDVPMSSWNFAMTTGLIGLIIVSVIVVARLIGSFTGKRHEEDFAPYARMKPTSSLASCSTSATSKHSTLQPSSNWSSPAEGFLGA